MRIRMWNRSTGLELGTAPLRIALGRTPAKSAGHLHWAKQAARKLVAGYCLRHRLPVRSDIPLTNWRQRLLREKSSSRIGGIAVGLTSAAASGAKDRSREGAHWPKRVQQKQGSAGKRKDLCRRALPTGTSFAGADGGDDDLETEKERTNVPREQFSSRKKLRRIEPSPSRSAKSKDSVSEHWQSQCWTDQESSSAAVDHRWQQAWKSEIWRRNESRNGRAMKGSRQQHFRSMAEALGAVRRTVQRASEHDSGGSHTHAAQLPPFCEEGARNSHERVGSPCNSPRMTFSSKGFQLGKADMRPQPNNPLQGPKSFPSSGEADLPGQRGKTSSVNNLRPGVNHSNSKEETPPEGNPPPPTSPASHKEGPSLPPLPFRTPPPAGQSGYQPRSWPGEGARGDTHSEGWRRSIALSALSKALDPSGGVAEIGGGQGALARRMRALLAAVGSAAENNEIAAAERRVGVLVAELEQAANATDLAARSLRVWLQEMQARLDCLPTVKELDEVLGSRFCSPCRRRKGSSGDVVFRIIGDADSSAGQVKKVVERARGALLGMPTAEEVVSFRRSARDVLFDGAEELEGRTRKGVDELRGALERGQQAWVRGVEGPLQKLEEVVHVVAPLESFWRTDTLATPHSP